MEQITFVYTTQPEAMWRFYGETLGLGLTFEKGGCRIYRVTPNSYIGVCHRADREVHPKGVCLSFVAHEVDGWYQRLNDAGIPTDGPPRETEAYGIYHFFAYDPEGHAVEFQRFTDPAWPGAREVL